MLIQMSCLSTEIYFMGIQNCLTKDYSHRKFSWRNRRKLLYQDSGFTMLWFSNLFLEMLWDHIGLSSVMRVDNIAPI